MSADLEKLFPALASTGYAVTSPATSGYNCVAWAAGDDTTWWWPDAFEMYYWPPEAPRAETLDAFAAAFATLGVEPCEDGSIAPGVEKIALYVNPWRTPTHAARQLPSGRWTSKLGQLEDIEHSASEGVAGGSYGTVGLFLRRRA